MTYFLFPSILFVVTSYMSFWISKEAAPARVSLAILTILIAINFQSSIHKYIPQIPYSTWISGFMLGIQVFCVITMLQYSILNYSFTTNNRLKKKISELINDLANIKNKPEIEELQQLEEARDKAKEVMKESS